MATICGHARCVQRGGVNSSVGIGGSTTEGSAGGVSVQILGGEFVRG